MAPQITKTNLDPACDAAHSALSTSRRCFLRNGAAALVGASAVPALLQHRVLAETTTAAASRKKLVVVFQRGAADGLNIVVPYREPSYYQLRPTIAIPQQQLLDLDGFFGLHPAMSSLMPLYREGSFAVVHAVGSPDTTRSHFDAQDSMESGTPGLPNTPDGWLNRALQAKPARQPPSPFRAVAIGSQLPRTLQGAAPALAIQSLQDFGAAVSGRHDDSARCHPAPGASYPEGAFGNNLRQIAHLLKADLGVEAAFTAIGGWDTHQNQGAAEGQLANRLREFSDSLAAFWSDMGDAAADITLVTMSEFGRAARENGTGGTDHGHATVMFVLSGSVQGGKVYGDWPGLAPEQLNHGRDLRVTTDFRSALGEALAHTLGCNNMQSVFPNAPVSTDQFLGLFLT